MKVLAEELGVTVLLVDINGSRPLKTLLPLLDAYKITMKPRLVIVKNHKLGALLRSTELSSDVLALDLADSDNNSSTGWWRTGATVGIMVVAAALCFRAGRNCAR